MEKLINKNSLGIIITLLGASFWGFSGTCGSYLFINKSVTADMLVPVRMIISGLIMMIFYIFKYKGKIFAIWKGKRNAVDLILFSVFGILACQYTYFYSIQYSNAGTATVLQYLNPVFIMIVVCLKNKKLPKINEFICIFFALAGTFLIATHGSFSTLAISPKALIVGVISAWTCVIYSLQPRRLTMQFETPFILGWALFLGGLVSLPLFRPWQYSYIIDSQAVFVYLGIIIFGTILAFSFYLTGVKILGPVKASLFASIEPVSAAVISAIWIGTDFTLIDILGFVFIVSTIFILALTDKKKVK